jgi:hypothetical protein
MPERHTMNYIESDVFGELTLVEWRRAHTPAKPRRRLPLRPRFAFAAAA